MKRVVFMKQDVRRRKPLNQTTSQLSLEMRPSEVSNGSTLKTIKTNISVD